MGIPTIVKLKVGAQYMVTYNLDTDDGLCNGATGKLKRIDFGTNAKGEKKPLRLWIKFHECHVGKKMRHIHKKTISEHQIPDTWTPLFPLAVTVKTRKNSSLKINRMQFPLTLAHALTIHKSQGQSLKKVVVHIKKTLSRELLYVACSRATSLNGLFIIGSFKAPNKLDENGHLAQEIKRWKNNKVIPQFKHLHHSDCFQIMFHNVQSLEKHCKLVTNDLNFISSDVLLFGETWMSSIDNIKIHSFKLVTRTNDGLSRKPRGTAIYVKSEIRKEILDSNSFIINTHNGRIDTSWIKLKRTIIVAVYAKPQTSLTLWKKWFPMKTRGMKKNYKTMAEGKDDDISNSDFEPFMELNKIKLERFSDQNDSPRSVNLISSDSDDDPEKNVKDDRKSKHHKNSISSSDDDTSCSKFVSSKLPSSNQYDVNEPSSSTSSLQQQLKEAMELIAKLQKVNEQHKADQESNTNAEIRKSSKKRIDYHQQSSKCDDSDPDSDKSIRGPKSVKKKTVGTLFSILQCSISLSTFLTHPTQTSTYEHPQSLKQPQESPSDTKLKKTSSKPEKRSSKHFHSTSKRVRSSSSESDAPPAKLPKKTNKYYKKASASSDSDESNEIFKIQMQLNKLLEKKRQKKIVKKSSSDERNETSSDEETSNKKTNPTPKNQNDDLINILNDTQTLTCRDLKLNKKYTLVDINIVEENGFNGTYKKATARFSEKSKPTGYINVLMPKPVANLPQNVINQMKTRVQGGNPPTFTVMSIKSRERADGKGSYDVVDYKWI
ncbi:ATP-dependent DNA helicase [Frankliniella fusca]|uniref:ATP-dependent DNA helicase n=1 Tax=Frankliniella fusca TaxID=407009 RepID=A0AAE1I315_9NEOP|nr:ATP-dependent DNA helicase [Frankliniella fusca]